MRIIIGLYEIVKHRESMYWIYQRDLGKLLLVSRKWDNDTYLIGYLGLNKLI